MNENGKGDFIANHYPYFTHESGEVEVLRVLAEGSTRSVFELQDRQIRGREHSDDVSHGMDAGSKRPVIEAFLC